MQVNDAILNRKSVRAFLNTPVDLSIIDRAIEIAKYSPSSTNMQPWEVAVVTGATKAKIANSLTQEFLTSAPKTSDYSSYPKEWFEPFISRRRELGISLYSALNIQHGDKEGQKNHWIKNYDGFGAPVLIFIFVDRKLSSGSFIDCGAFMQSLLLTLQNDGLATCPQASFIEFAQTVKQILGEKYLDKILITGIAVGYEDHLQSVNKFRSTREENISFVDHFD